MNSARIFPRPLFTEVGVVVVMSDLARAGQLADLKHQALSVYILIVIIVILLSQDVKI